MSQENLELVTYLRGLVARVCEPYKAMPETRAILSIGSVAYGIVDRFSDIDIAIYYEDLPSDAELKAAMVLNGCESVEWSIGDRSEGGLIESYKVHGVECQFAHSTIEAWERDVNTVLVQFDVETPMQKALSGVLAGMPIYGSELIERFKSRVAEYPPALGLAMVKKHLAFQPLWLISERLKVRDGLLWKQHALVEGGQNMLGVLAGVNGLYYSTFQFKRMGDFIQQMQCKPDQLYERITAMFEEPEQAIEIYQGLVSDVVEIVEARLPEVDTAAIRGRLGRTEQEWTSNT